MSFAFPTQTPEFLRTLRDNNDREWFNAHRPDYEASYVEPAKEFVAAAEQALVKLAPAICAEPRVLGSIFRINRDARFSKDTSPYKDYLDFWFWEGERKQAQTGFFLRVTPAIVGIGAGSHGFGKEALERFREAVADPGAGGALAKIAAALERKGYTIGGERYVRIPRGMDPGGPGARFLRHNALFVHHDEPVDVATDPARLLPACRKVWKDLAPLHRWLVDQVQ